MANDLNRCEFIGRLGKDPEVRYTPNGDAAANFSIAVSESWKNKQTGEKEERTTWVPIVAWRKLAEIIGEYVKKGSRIYIAGKFQVRKWQTQDGQDRYTTEVVADQLQMLDSKQQNQRPAQQPAQPAPADDGFNDDIQF